MLEPQKRKYRKALRTSEKENAKKQRLVFQLGIKLARLEAGLMQTTLADMVQISKQHLSSIESGKKVASLFLITEIYRKCGRELEIKVIQKL